MRRCCLVLLGVIVAVPAALSAQPASQRTLTLRVVSHQALVRSALDNLVPPERRVSLTGAEVLIPTPWSALHVEARLLQSDRGDPDLRFLDAGLVLGWPVVGFAAAYGQRGSYDPSTGHAHARDADFGRVGVRLRASPRAAFSLHLRGDAYVPISAEDSPAEGLRGWDAEGGVTWRARELPFTASLGYRLERFHIFGVDQEVSALTVGLGLAFGGR